MMILLCGPSPEPGARGYGGGKGGYVRNVDALLKHFSSGDIRMVLSPYSSRRYSRWWKVLLPFRLMTDLGVFARNITQADAVHLMMTYGLAIYREFGMSVIAAMFRRPLILDIRGGSFEPWLKSAGWIQRAMAHSILRRATVILGQGKALVNVLRPQYGAKVHHFPNFIQSAYLPPTVSPRLAQSDLKVIFVGYCYAGKGVFELVDGCALAAQNNVCVNLTLVGAESPQFSEYLDNYSLPNGLQISRHGTLEFADVQLLLAVQDIFCLPTRHIGEGHPNVITEAMAHGLVIVTTRHGFIAELLDESSAYFILPGSAATVAEVLGTINAHREEARKKASKARWFVQQHFTEERVLGRLREYYLSTLQRGSR
jgi:glycosyltransferase involved in cell wall biosynthesis